MTAKTKVSSSAEETVKHIRRETRRKWNVEEKSRIVLEGLRGEVSIAELCRREGLNPNLYYKWRKGSNGKSPQAVKFLGVGFGQPQDCNPLK